MPKIHFGLLYIKILVIFLFPISPAYAKNPPKAKGFGGLWCGTKAVTEYFVPGLGYLLSFDLDKALLFGASRHYFKNEANKAKNEDSYQGFNDTFEEKTDEKTKDGEKITHKYYFFNKSTIDFQRNARYDQNLVMISFGDMYTHSCESNTETYYRFTDPFNFPHFYDKWYFWTPLLLLSASLSSIDKDTHKTTFFLGKGATKSDLYNQRVYPAYTIGISEEAFFRRFVQTAFYDFYSGNGFSKTSSHHLGVLSSSIIFGVAHAGNVGSSASAANAFLLGFMFGYIFQPSPDEFDIITASAVHSWWDYIIFANEVNNADVKKLDDDIEDNEQVLSLFSYSKEF